MSTPKTATALGLIFSLFAATGAHASDAQRIDIAGQPLATALAELSAETDISIVASPMTITMSIQTSRC